MDNDPGLICFRHCAANNVFCKNIPKMCPICHSQISNYDIPPFRVPFPLKNALHEPTTIAIRPSSGTFLDNYDITSDLHIGIVNSQGIIFEFDNKGLVVNDFPRWTNCITLSVIPSSWSTQWDNVLDAMAKHAKWKAHNYDSISMNCFTFVIEFLKNLGHIDLVFAGKENLCEKLILPKFQDLFRYIVVYRKLKNNEFFVS